MNFRNISAWSIRHPIPAIVLFTALTLMGIMSFMRMSVTQNPDVDFPAAMILISQPGAAPTELETQVAQKVEAAVRSINGIDEINSTVSEGSARVVVQFAIGTPIDRAVNDVRDAVANIRSDLPEGILEPQVQRLDSSGEPIAYISVEATDMTLEELSWFVDNIVAKRLRGIPGVAAIERDGGVSREIRVILDPARMQALGVTASQINNQLRQVNVNAAGGRAEIAGSEQSVRVLGNARTAHDLGETQISLGGGRTVKLSDVADVRDLYGEQRSYALMNGKQVLSFSITRAKGASDVSVYHQVQQELDKLKTENPKVKYSELFSSVEYTESEYHSSMMAMVEGAVLAVVVVFLFLRDWRATIISALAIPLSAVPTFWFMDLMGFSLNQISLLALSLVAGVLVDDAIVEIENIVRHMRMGKSAYQAAIDAADEIGLAVLATTSAIVAVFLPVGIMPGVSGQFFKNFGLTVVVAVLMSLAVARLITPMIAAYFLKSHGEQDHAQGTWVRKYVDLLRWTLTGPRVAEIRAQVAPVKGRTRYYLIYWAMVAGIAIAVIAGINLLPTLVPGDWLNPALVMLVSLPAGLFAGLWTTRKLTDGLDRDGYDDRLPPRFGQWARSMSQRVRARLHDHRVWTMGAGYGALLLTVMAFMTLQFTFQPEMDVDFSQIRIEMTPGTTLQQTAAVTREVQTMLDREQSDTVEAAYASISPASARIFLTLRKDRAMSSVDFEKKWSPRLARIADARVSFSAQNSGFSGRALSITLASDDPVKLARTANQLVAEMQRLPELVAPRVAGDLVRPEIVIRPRMDLAASLGVTTAALSQTIRLATLGDIDQNSAKFSLSDRQIPIRVSLSEESRRDLATIQNLPVQTTSGASVPLKSVAEISFGSGPTTIQRTNQSRRLTIGADLSIDPATGKAFVSGEAMSKINELPTLQNLPMGVTRMTVGQSKIEQEMVTNFLVAIVSGVFLVFAVLVLLYHRIMPPFVNMGSLLLAPLGAALALHLFGMPLSMPVFIGVLMLLGIVAKNSILMVDFALEEMNKGIDRFEAIMDAGRKRAQPIVMTTVAMVAGMVPTALALSGDGAWRQPMGVTVIGGLVVSTMLTLLIVPAAFSLAVGFETRMGPWLRHKLLTYKPGDDTAHPGAVPHPAE